MYVMYRAETVTELLERTMRERIVFMQCGCCYQPPAPKGAQLTHGYCWACFLKLYGDIFEEEELEEMKKSKDLVRLPNDGLT